MNWEGNGGTIHRLKRPIDFQDVIKTLLQEYAKGDRSSVIAPRTATVGNAYHSGVSGTGPIELDVTVDVQAWVSGLGNYGWAFLPWPEGGDGWGFCSPDVPNVADRPLLTVTFLPPTIAARARRTGGSSTISLSVDGASAATVSAVYALGKRLTEADRLREAVVQFERALEYQRKLMAEHPERADYRKTLSDCCNRLSTHYSTYLDQEDREPRRAVELSREAVALQPNDAGSWENYGWALYRAGDWRGCVAAVEKSVSLAKGGSGWDWFFLAMAHRQLGDAARAKPYYRDAVAWLKAQPANVHYLLKAQRIRDEAAALLGTSRE